MGPERVEFHPESSIRSYDNADFDSGKGKKCYVSGLVLQHQDQPYQ